jgi:hypothetical protein
MQVCGASRDLATATLLRAAATKIAGTCATSRGSTATAYGRVTTAPSRAIARGAAERCACTSGRTAGSRRRHVEEEAIVARRAAQSERQHGSERGRDRAPAIHGSAASRWASLTANPLG